MHQTNMISEKLSANNSGVLGIEYEEVERVVNRSDDDWMTG